MKLYREVQKTRTEKEFIERTCDLCYRKAKDKYNWFGDDIFEVEQVDISVTQRGGVEYPEGGNGTFYDIDLCPECFVKKLVPWLKSQGANIEEREWDW